MNQHTSGKRPHIIVGIDFGHTHTGVSYTCLEVGEIFEPSVVNRWPGRMDEVINKVPTKISYKGLNASSVGWGFELNQNQGRKANGATRAKGKVEIVDHFKLWLDEKILLEAHELDMRERKEDEDYEEYDPSLFEETKRAFKDYLVYLYAWIKKTLEKEGFVWEECRVEFIFSVPTTWDHKVVQIYETIIASAGYKSVRGHTAHTGFTEAEAAAVYTAVYDAKGVVGGNKGERKARRYEKDDVLLVCDAGGGTTDVSALQVRGFRNNIPEMDQLGPVSGYPVGSVNIDSAFEDLVMERLQQVTPVRPNGTDFFDRASVATQMTAGDFQKYKVHFGESSADLPSFTIAVPGLDDRDSWPAARVIRGQMRFTKAEIQKLFDDVMVHIFGLIDDVLSSVEENVKHLVLSGGLGSSGYLRQCLEQRYIRNKTFNNTAGLELLVAKDPPLVICRGLVLGRIQDSFKVSVISGRCCRASYGITYDEPYDRTRHNRKDRFKNGNDKQYYVPGHIYWLIKKGEFIKDDQPPTKNFRQSLSFRSGSKSVNHQIVQCNLSGEPPAVLRIGDKDVKVVCKVSCNLDSAIAKAQSAATEQDHVEVQKRHQVLGQSFGRRFYVVNYDMLLKIGHADLKPELWFDGLDRAESTHISVDWKTERRVISELEDHTDDLGYESSTYEKSLADSGYGGGRPRLFSKRRRSM